MGGIRSSVRSISSSVSPAARVMRVAGSSPIATSAASTSGRATTASSARSITSSGSREAASSEL